MDKSILKESYIKDTAFWQKQVFIPKAESKCSKKKHVCERDMIREKDVRRKRSPQDSESA